jgi:Domain of unknown function (DUF4136)
MKRRLALLLPAFALLAGCAGLRSVTSDVSSFGEWPADRKPGRYAFDRLPSQQAQAAQTDVIEAAARTALQKAGFTPAAAGEAPDVLVQVGARTARGERGVWDDPFWWRGSFGYWHRSPWRGPSWGLSASFPVNPRYDREVALLIRDRESGKPLYEARASNEGNYSLDALTMGAMFEAALMDFPRLGVNPRRVVVPGGG